MVLSGATEDPEARGGRLALAQDQYETKGLAKRRVCVREGTSLRFDVLPNRSLLSERAADLKAPSGSASTQSPNIEYTVRRSSGSKLANASGASAA